MELILSHLGFPLLFLALQHYLSLFLHPESV
jgi:hypothetical protein